MMKYLLKLSVRFSTKVLTSVTESTTPLIDPSNYIVYFYLHSSRFIFSKKGWRKMGRRRSETETCIGRIKCVYYS